MSHSHTMVRSITLCYFMVVILATVSVSEGANENPKLVKCNKDKKLYPDCTNQMYCPGTCPRDCKVDCDTCQPVCTLPPPPPPPPPPVYTPHTPPPPPDVIPQTPPPPPDVTSETPPPPPDVIPQTPPPPPDVTSETPPPPPPDTSGASGGTRVRCMNREFRFRNCFGIEHRCPAACPNQCQVNCVTCSPVCDCNRPGAVCQDPRFVGGDGLTFYFHGKRGRNFCLVSDKDLHINAHFIGKPGPKTGARDFTWVQSLGILFGSSHNLSVSALRTASWDDSVDRLSLSLDGSPVPLLSREWRSQTSPQTIIFRRPHGEPVNSVEVEVEGLFLIKARVVPITAKDSRIHNYGIVEGEDVFAHLDVSFRLYSLGDDVDGVLGRTYRSDYVSRAKMDVAMPVLGGDREFAASGLFEPDCAASKYGHKKSLLSLKSSTSVGVLHCDGGTGFGGRGVVCRR